MSLTKSLSRCTPILGAMSVLGGSAMLLAPSAQAAAFNIYDLDFNYSSLVVNGTATGYALDAYDLDKNSGQTIDGTKYSTKIGNIGDIWGEYGITINALANDGIAANKAPLGLFNSACKPKGGTSDSGFTANCEIGRHGDNDLATGKGSYKNSTINYDTLDQGNLLIFEENEGNGTPDDTAKGGTFLFNIDADKQWTIDQIAIVDDAQGQITYTYRDGTQSSEDISIAGENELKFFSAAENKAISQVAVQFDNSGGIGGLRFREVQPPIPRVPEPASVVGLLVVGGLASRLRRRESSTTV